MCLPIPALRYNSHRAQALESSRSCRPWRRPCPGCRRSGWAASPSGRPHSWGGPPAKIMGNICQLQLVSDLETHLTWYLIWNPKWDLVWHLLWDVIWVMICNVIWTWSQIYIYLNSSKGVLSESQLLPPCLKGNETWCEGIGWKDWAETSDLLRQEVQDQAGRTQRGQWPQLLQIRRWKNSFIPLDTKVFIPALPDGEDYHKEREWNPCNEVCFWRSFVKN